MDRNKTVELLLAIKRPGGARTEGPLGAVLRSTLGGQKPNEKRSIEERTNAAMKSFDQAIHFLAGVLTVISFLRHQNPMLKFESEKLFLDGHQLRARPEFSAAFIRRLRIHEEKILRVVEKIEKAR